MSPPMPGGDVLELLARVGGTVAGDPTVWVHQDVTELVASCVLDLEPGMRGAFLDAFQEQPWNVLIVANDLHPALDRIIAWADGRPATLLLATPSGPPAPAIAVYERRTEASRG